MAYEYETKVLEVNKDQMIQRLESLGAEKVGENRLVVDWYSLKHLAKDEPHPWCLRIRTYSSGKSECTWKDLPTQSGILWTHKEIQFTVDNPKALAELFEELELKHYAHQEKDRISYTLKEWSFEIDTYPKIPTYIEIEGKDEDHIKEAVALLGLENNTATSLGEVKLINEQYKTDWFDMRF